MLDDFIEPLGVAWAQIEGRGNGIKTNVVNNVEVAKALERPPDCEYRVLLCHLDEPQLYLPASLLGTLCIVKLLTMLLLYTDLVKFYGCELGAQTKYDKKSGTSIVNGAHDTSKLCELLEVRLCHHSLQKIGWLPLKFHKPVMLFF